MHDERGVEGVVQFLTCLRGQVEGQVRDNLMGVVEWADVAGAVWADGVKFGQEGGWDGKEGGGGWCVGVCDKGG
jgi:hypothetical protein